MSASEEIRRADSISAGLNRGLNVEPMRWEELLAIAQREINEYQRRVHLERSTELYEEELATPLIAAARIVLETATRSTTETAPSELGGEWHPQPVDSEERHLLLLLASCAFGMYGNFPSSAAVQRSINLHKVKSAIEWVVLSLCNPKILPSALESAFVQGAYREFLERFNMFLLTGDEVEASRLVAHFEELMRCGGSAAEVMLLRCARLSLKHCINLAIIRLRNKKHDSLLNGFIRKIILSGRPCLLPPQYNVISDGFLELKSNAIVTIPTSTGKTTLGELALAARMQGNGDLSLYVTPYVALGRQVYETIRGHAPPGVDVRGYFGNFNSHLEEMDMHASTVVVATPERVDGILRARDLYSRLRTVVFDEAHGVESGVRGVRLESLVARMRLQQDRGADLRLILISAVLSDVDSLVDWLGPQTEHFQDSWRPTTRRLAIWSNAGNLGWLYGSDPLRPEGKNRRSYLGVKNLEWPEESWPTKDYRAVVAQQPAAYRNVSFLARYAHRNIGGPVLVACYSKNSTRGVASAIAQEMKDRDTLPSQCERLLSVLSAYPHLKPLASMVRRGVAYHNASLPSNVKVLIEEALKARAIDYVVATTTLAEGVDLPIRVTIVFDWLIGFGDSQGPMSPLLFRNIAGRCGRAGEFTEGDTIIFDNTIGNFNLVSDRSRERLQATLLDDPPPLRSVIANANLPPETKHSVRAMLSSQLMAAIPENPDDESVEKSLSNALFACHHGFSSDRLFSELRGELLDDKSGEPFAIASSPMRLTNLGRAANRTGFSPITCRLMLSFLRSAQGDLAPDAIGAVVLERFGLVAEQSNFLLREVASDQRGSKFFVKSSDFSGLALGWLQGTPLPELFVELPAAVRSKAAVSPLRWASGEAENSFVSGQYDKFVDFMGYSFGSFLPWVLRALANLSMILALPPPYSWAEIADAFEASRLIDPDAIVSAGF